ncbi:MAG: hypothetical protein AAF328_00355 [Planctomycetota bacterium]
MSKQSRNIARQELDRYFSGVLDSPKQVQREGRRALIDALRRSKSYASRAARAVLVLNVASINRRTTVKTPAAGGELKGSIQYEDPGNQPPALSSFPYRLTRAGLSVRVRKGVSTERWPGAFVIPNTRARTPAAVQNLIAIRTAGRSLRVLRGPSIVGLLAGRPGFGDDIEAHLADQVETQLERRLVRALDRKAKS